MEASVLVNLSVNVSPLVDICFTSTWSIIIFSAFSTINLVVLLPILLLVLCLGYQERKQPRPSSAASPSDLFVYHSIVMQLVVFAGFICYFCGGYVALQDVTLAGMNIWSTTAHGQAMFHILTCVERCLAVAQPITYRRLRQAGGVRVIYLSVGCVWLLSLGWLAVCYLSSHILYLILYCCDMAFFLLVISLSSFYVLWALKRPGPVREGGNKEKGDQSKQRAFHNITLITAVLLMRFGWNLISLLINSAQILRASSYCVVVLSAFWVDLPSCLVLPLLFLHRRGKLCCWKHNPETG